MLGFLKHRNKRRLGQELAETDSRIAVLKIELAAKMIKLAAQTDDLAPLKQAEEALSSARNYYTFETIPLEVGLVHIALGDMLMRLGTEKSNKGAIASALESYRAAITLASVHGDDNQRLILRKKAKKAESLLGRRPPPPSLFKVA